MAGRIEPNAAFNSQRYWEERYKSGGYSGAGSVGRLAYFKASTLNAFVSHYHIQTIIEFGCGDGAQLSLADYPSYVGIDVSTTAISNCRARFQADRNKHFHVLSDFPNPRDFDLSLSLDVIYHLIEDEVFSRYMEVLFAASRRYVIIYSSNMNAVRAAHVRDRCFTDWVESQQPGWNLFQHIPNQYPWDSLIPHETSSSEFYIYRKSRDLYA